MVTCDDCGKVFDDKHDSVYDDGDECPDCGGRLEAPEDHYVTCDNCAAQFYLYAGWKDGDECPGCGARLEAPEEAVD